jgi:hypothetical protein
MGLASWIRSLVDVARRRPWRGAPTRRSWNRVVVVFTRPDRDIARLDIGAGPCVAPPGRRRPLVGVTNQLPGDPAMWEDLFGILVEDPSVGPWKVVTTVNRGQLHVFGAVFVEALAALNRENLRRQNERPGDYDWIFDPERNVFERWMPSVRWPVGAASVPALASELGGACAWARVAQERGQKLYCWSGPGFNPWVLTERRVQRLINEVAHRSR